MKVLIVEDNVSFANKLHHDLFIHLSDLDDDNTFDIITSDFLNLQKKNMIYVFLILI